MEDLVRQVLQQVQRQRRVRSCAQAERPVEQRVTLMRVDARQRAQQGARLPPHGRRLWRAAPQAVHERRDFGRQRCARELVLPYEREAEAQQGSGRAVVGGTIQGSEAGGPAVGRVSESHEPCIGFGHGRA